MTNLFQSVMDRAQQIRDKKFNGHLTLVALNGLNLGKIPAEEQTPEICLTAVRQNGMALQHVALRKVNSKPGLPLDTSSPDKIKIVEILFAAVAQNGLAIQFVSANDKSPELCMLAVKQNGQALRYIRMQTDEICLEAIAQDPSAITFVKDRSFEFCCAAARRNSRILWHMENPSVALCMEAIDYDFSALNNIKNQTPEMCFAAVTKDIRALDYVHDEFLRLSLMEHFAQAEHAAEYAAESAQFACA